MKLGIRVDVDTFNGTRSGVPRLCELFSRHSVKATFFFSVGPDNMGRHIWRLLRPKFLVKMLRTRAASLYGWGILTRGTFWPGPLIGDKLGSVISSAARDGHETGLHAWDHHQWQSRIDQWDAAAIHRSLDKGFAELSRIIGTSPVCSAVPAWKCNDLVLSQKSRFPFRYNSDCKGQSIFLPIINGNQPGQMQVPVTLPTYDEVVGANGITDENYNEHILSLIKPDGLNVLTIHAEVEGGTRSAMFDSFLSLAIERGVECVPLGSLLDVDGETASARVVQCEIPGRDGWIACQEERPADARV